MRYSWLASVTLLAACSSSSGPTANPQGVAGSAGSGGSAVAGAPGSSGATAAGGGGAGTSGSSSSSGGNANAGATSGGLGGGSSGTAGTHAGGQGGAAGTAGTSSGGQGGSSGAPPGWVLKWADEFDGPDGSAVDPNKWVHDVGGDGWGNQELEYYTDGTQNAVVQGGNLVITATKAGAGNYQCSYPSKGACQYTSARLKTEAKFSQQYGRFEARIQIPEGQGIWPAFWMLGADIATVSWPTCGEIDIMENIGKEPSINHGSLHLPAAGTTNDASLTGQYSLPGGAKLGDAFHDYAIEWSAAAIKFYLDGQLYETQTPATATGRTWSFDKPFFLILNVAVGGQWPGAPDGTTTLPQQMKVDWVRVYQPG